MHVRTRPVLGHVCVENRRCRPREWLSVVEGRTVRTAVWYAFGQCVCQLSLSLLVRLIVEVCFLAHCFASVTAATASRVVTATTIRTVQFGRSVTVSLSGVAHTFTCTVWIVAGAAPSWRTQWWFPPKRHRRRTMQLAHQTQLPWRTRQHPSRRQPFRQRLRVLLLPPAPVLVPVVPRQRKGSQSPSGGPGQRRRGIKAMRAGEAPRQRRETKPVRWPPLLDRVASLSLIHI